MSNPYLPAEILDHIVDLLRDTTYPLRNCCLVSQSWIPRTRKHLFADIKLYTVKNLQSWKNKFPDPSTSPAHYTKTLSIGCPEAITAADAEGDGWIRAFSRVVHLEVEIPRTAISLVPLHGFSPVIKSLRVACATLRLPLSQIFNLILSFPLLEDLSVIACDPPIDSGHDFDGQPTVVYPSNPPTFTGSLELFLVVGVNHIARQLLSLPGGLHFQKLTLRWKYKEDLLLTMALVERCCSTLESLDIRREGLDEPWSGLIDLSKATKLKDVVFACGHHPQWAVMALRTVTPNHRDLQQFSLDTPYITYWPHLRDINTASVRGALGETVHAKWLEIDHLLAQLWESHMIRPKVLYSSSPWMNERKSRRFVEILLPEVTARGTADLIGRRYRYR